MSLPNATEHWLLELNQLRRLEIASLLEGSTLIVLLFVGVPMKHLGGWPAATAVLGPVHGLAFLIYIWTVVETVAGGGWTRRETVRLLLAGFIPFGGFVNIAFLLRKAARLSRPDAGRA
jgi:integral membrane protein